MLSRLVDRFWTRHNARQDPNVGVKCLVCPTTVRRADLFGGRCCSQECWNEDIANGV